MECRHFSVCLNNAQCYRCTNEDLLKLPPQRSYINHRSLRKPWQKLERDVADSLNSARLQPGSGNRWYAPGDVITPNLLVECKSHCIQSRGSLQHTVHKLHLDKIAQEAAISGRLPVYAFRFKDDERIYAVVDFDFLAGLLAQSK